MTMAKSPKEGEIVFVEGGVAQYRGGTFYSGMDDPRYTRPIQWPVKWWKPITAVPLNAKVRRSVIVADTPVEDRLAAMREAGDEMFRVVNELWFGGPKMPGQVDRVKFAIAEWEKVRCPK
jgi:hypothetical protein